jgi:hypothetical protein
MTSNLYDTALTSEEYFKTFKESSLKYLPNRKKEKLYKRYLIKFAVFNRDTFKCKNQLCLNNTPEITMHHIIKQSRGGEDTEDNCVTLCKSCHKRYHTKGATLIINNISYKDDETPLLLSSINDLSSTKFKYKLVFPTLEAI